MKVKKINRNFDRIIAGNVWKQVLTLLIAMVIAWFALFIVVILIDCCSSEELLLFGSSEEGDISTGWGVLFQMLDTGNAYMTTLGTSTWIARPIGFLLAFVGGIVFSGLVISSMSNMFERRIDKIKNGLVHYKLNNHVVIIGAGDMLHSLIQQICKMPKYDNCDIAVQTAKDVNYLRICLEAKLSKEDFKRVVLMYGQRNSLQELRQLQLEKAKELFILGEGSIEQQEGYFNDSMNFECLNLVAQILNDNQLKEQNCNCADAKNQENEHDSPKHKKLLCNMMFNYQTVFSAFQNSDIEKSIKQVIDFQLYNPQSVWAQKVLVNNKSCDDVAATQNRKRQIIYKPLDYETIDYASEKYVHLIIFGMTKFGVSLAVEAAHIAHFPNFIRDAEKRTKITFVDINAYQEMDFFKGRFSSLFSVSYSKFIDAMEEDIDYWTNFPLDDRFAFHGDNYIDVEWEFIQGSAEMPLVRKYITESLNDENALTTLAVCLDEPHISIACALYLPEDVYKKNIPVLVLQQDSDAIIRNFPNAVKDGDYVKYKNLQAFGMLSDSYDLLLSNTEYAKRVNAIYDYYYKNNQIPTSIPEELLSDNLWFAIPIVKRWSNIYNANSIPTKLRSIGYTLENCPETFTDEEIDILSQVEHNRWNVEELLLGYRPVTEEENRQIMENRALKKVYKSQFIHFDIRHFDDLQKDANGNQANEYDIVLSKCIPLICGDLNTNKKN
jgi:hypothetical protein